MERLLGLVASVESISDNGLSLNIEDRGLLISLRFVDDNNRITYRDMARKLLVKVSYRYNQDDKALIADATAEIIRDTIINISNSLIENYRRLEFVREREEMDLKNLLGNVFYEIEKKNNL